MKKKRAMKRVLVVNPYGIGDCLFTTPMLRALKKTPSVERVDVMLGSRTDEVFRNNPNVDEIYSLNKDELSRMFVLRRFWHLFRFYSRLKKNRYDTFFDLSLTREYAFFAKFFLGIRCRIGFDYKKRGTFLNRKQPLPEGFSGKRVIDYYTDLVKFTEAPVPRQLEMDFSVPKKVFQRVEETLRRKGIPRGARLVSVSAGGGASWGKDAHFKQWPPRYFKELLEKIHLAFPLDAVLFIGGPGDDLLNREAAQGLSIPHHHLAGELSLTETAACLQLSRFALVNEGGIYHLAASQKVPVITLTGPVDENVYRSTGSRAELFIFKEGLECRPCYKRFRYNAQCPHVDCLRKLTPEEVYRKILQARFLYQLEKTAVLAPQ